MKTTKQKLGKVTIPAMMPEISIFLSFAFSLVFGFVSFPIPMRIHFRDKNKNQVRNNNKRTIPKVELFIISSYQINVPPAITSPPIDKSIEGFTLSSTTARCNSYIFFAFILCLPLLHTYMV